MKSRNTILAAIVAASIFPLFVLQTHARPRPPQPPWPEPTLRIYGFDAAYQRGPWKDIAINEEDSVAESWSGYSLVREGVVVSPVVIPVDVESKRPNYKLDSGAIRFWFAPNWTSSNSKEGGRGPGHLASLVELVSLDEKKPAVKWSLCVNESGDTIYLAGESKAGTTIYLKAPVQFEAGDWRMITLGYSRTNTALWLDGELVAKGEGLPSNDWWETKNLGLVVGSDIYANGKSLAEGQFEELTTFASWPKKSDWQDFYFKSGKRRSFLGAVGTKEEEQMKSAVLREAGLIPEEEAGSTMLRSSGDGGSNAAYSYAVGTLWLEITGVSNNLARLIVHGTVANVAYEILSKESLTNAEWTGEQVILGAAGQDWTPTTVTVGTRTNGLFFWARTLVDADGDGLPDWWELAHGLDPNNPDTGNTGVSDGYKDSDNDGWTNLQEYQNGTNPSGLNKPPAPRAWAQVMPNTFNRVIHWETSIGNVQSYRLVKFQFYPVYDWGWPVSTQIVSSASLSVTDNNAHFQDYNNPGDFVDAYSLTAVYPNQTSLPAFLVDETVDFDIRLVRGSGSEMKLVLAYVNPNAIGLRIYMQTNNACGWGWGTNQTFDLPLAAFTNRVYSFSEAQYPLYAAYTIQAQAILPGGLASPPQIVETNCERCIRYPLIDASSALKGNLLFILQGQNLAPYYIVQTEGIGFGYRNGFPDLMPTFAVASFHSQAEYYEPLFSYEYDSPQKWSDVPSPLHPLEINYHLSNFVYQNPATTCWGLTNNNYSGGFGGIWVVSYGGEYFDAINFTSNKVSTACPSMLAAPSGRLFFPVDLDTVLIENNGNWSIDAVHPNAYGLALEGVFGQYNITSQPQYGYFPSGSSCPSDLSWEFYIRYAAPVLQAENFIFTRGGQIADIFPETCFTNSGIYATNLLITPVGQKDYSVSGWLRYRLTNGNANVYGYVERYFDKAYTTTNGIVTTNQTGILSPYGEFFPTEPGRMALVTMPDLDTGARGTATVYVVSMNLDANHDGVMDRSFFGPDQTSASKPFQFWINNDNDGSDFSDGHEIDVSGVPDSRDNEIKSKRDLEDYARLWISGIPPLTNGQGYTVTLSSSGPAIQLFPAYESADGGIGYITNATTAANQITSSSRFALGIVAPGTNYVFPDGYFANFGRKHFLFEGVTAGAGTITLTIAQGSNVLMEHSIHMDLRDVKDMIEWAHAENVTSGFPPSSLVSTFKLDHPPAVVSGEAKQITIFVHGINNTEFGAQNTAQTLFKRLYWSGYQGRVAGFRWPCSYLPEDNSINPAEYLKALNFNKGEYYAWKSANAFKLYLQSLTNRLAGYQINVLAHSQGNIVASEAVKQGAPFDNYILSQAAVPAHCYDTSTNVPFLQKLLNAETNIILPKPTPFYSTNGGYHGYFASLAGNLINFYNANDYALATGTTGPFETNWEENQRAYKPESFIGGATYSYNPATFTTIGSFPFSSYTVTDLQELKAAVARSRSKAVGAQGGVAGAVVGSINLQASFNFGTTREEHSGQFNRNIQTATGYYQAIRVQIQVSP